MEGGGQKCRGRATPSCCKTLGQIIHLERTIQRTFWVLESPEVLRGRDIVTWEWQVTAMVVSLSLRMEQPSVLCPWQPWVLLIFPLSALLHLPFPKVRKQFLQSIFFFFPSLDLSTLLSSWPSAPEVPKSHCGAVTGASILNMA